MAASAVTRGAAPKQDRSRATRQRLLESAVTCLAEHGWTGSTVTVVAEHAGVSRGAAQHHFPTREDLFTAAVEYVAEERSKALELRGAGPAGPNGPAGSAGSARSAGSAGAAGSAASAGSAGSAGQAASDGSAGPAGGGSDAGSPDTGAAVAMIVSMYTGTLFRAALQLWVAAANEPQLGPRVQALEARIGREAHRTAIRLLGADESVPGVRETVQGLLDMARGLGLANLLTDDSARRERVVAQWESIIRQALAR